MTTFQEEFPSLIDYWRSAKDFPKDFIVIPVLDLYCKVTDNQKIKKVLSKSNISNDAVNEILEDLGI
jgi:uncharacterized protein YllA (UPF0747 family)